MDDDIDKGLCLVGLLRAQATQDPTRGGSPYPAYGNRNELGGYIQKGLVSQELEQIPDAMVKRELISRTPRGIRGVPYPPFDKDEDNENDYADNHGDGGHASDGAEDIDTLSNAEPLMLRVARQRYRAQATRPSGRAGWRKQHRRGSRWGRVAPNKLKIMFWRSPELWQRPKIAMGLGSRKAGPMPCMTAESEEDRPAVDGEPGEGGPSAESSETADEETLVTEDVAETARDEDKGADVEGASRGEPAHRARLVLDTEGAGNDMLGHDTRGRTSLSEELA
ncbi:hypothetical protein QQS21_004639 [Conoideocrella luteorostrata]|uniref:Uncharacterized protein n=1 Tax=Conoideocrella luteorostrata TaxID=1105319 RepID=A0AAJ0FZP1_9HYPO|nr:hypothetical protein QQS21_004639 [Conoideocrella luteorostrata]